MSLTLAEARERAGAISNVSYIIDLDLTSTEAFRSRTTVRFLTAAPDTFLELKGARSLSVEMAGAPVDVDYDGVRLGLRGLPTDREVEVVVEADLPYVSDGDGMHVFTDPADGERYVAAYVGMDVAQKVFTCFDQNDLKAPISLAVSADPAHTVLANGATRTHENGRWEFATTPPIPPALFVVAAGPWHSIRWEYAGLPFGWHARRSLAAALDRDAQELRRTTESCFDHYAVLFTEPYPFDSYDQVFVPGLNWGAQEMPGCVTYRDELLPVAITERQRAERAMVVAHEMAHMWFGDSMTMTWWEDAWLQESFADYMGYRVAEEAAGFDDLLIDLEAGRKPWGYAADARRSTHPVAPLPQDVPDVDSAATIFDGISYAKGNACLRQLAFWLGDEEFLAGINTHLTRFRLANATLADLVESLAASSSRDVRTWTEQWLRTPGHDTLTVTRDGQVPVLARAGLRVHAITVAAYDDALRLVGTRRVEVGDEPVRLEEYAGLTVVPNAGAETFADLDLDPVSRATLLAGLSRIEQPLVRAVVWSQTFRWLRRRELPAQDYLALLAEQVPRETQPTIIQAAFAHARKAVVERVAPDDAAAAMAVIAAAAGAGLEASTGDQERAFAHARPLAEATSDAALLSGWLRRGEVAGGVPLLPGTRWQALARLAGLGAADEALIEAERRGDGTFEGEVGAVRALAARPTAEAKTEAWAAMTADDVNNRLFTALAEGLWRPDQAALLGPYVQAYAAEGPRLAARGQAFAQTVGHAFPAIPLTAAQLDLFEQREVPTVLRRIWADAVDDRR